MSLLSSPLNDRQFAPAVPSFLLFPCQDNHRCEESFSFTSTFFQEQNVLRLWKETELVAGFLCSVLAKSSGRGLLIISKAGTRD
ncbi:hypothetical protein AMECASPLE_001296 [Ameca splendens]|uniref:Uncharacterized protein n=1 Tax=Ameca splendens TaxID=208324 RepID=A0ABV0ZU72_9TELE